jgi:flavin-dependent dehydrogenase
MAKTYDIAVLGATPAGCTAAWRLCKDKTSVVLVETPEPSPTEHPLLDWIPADCFETLGLPKPFPKQLDAVPFTSVIYHDKTLQHQAVSPASRKPLGYFASSETLVSAFKALARDAGAELRSPRTTPSLDIREDEARIELSKPVAGKVLLLAAGTPNSALESLGSGTRSLNRPAMLVAGLDLSLTPKQQTDLDERLAGAMHVVEMPERSELGLYFQWHRTLHVRVISTSSASGNRAAELSSLIGSLQKASLLPNDLPLGTARGAVWYPPAGMALDLESHEAKRCLLIGPAGGFAESVTGHGILPGVRSGLLAAKVARKALTAKQPQSVLMDFKKLWRKELADYLRPPNTLLSMLLPLLFVNERIVDKFTRALIHGEDI